MTPTTHGKYFLVRRLAVGGTAEIFHAKLHGADGFKKDLVIKQLLPQHARNPDSVESFVQEAKIAASLAHSNIAAVYELGRTQGAYFIAMEYVDGLNTNELINRSRLLSMEIPLPVALRVVEEVCRGLAYVHSKAAPDGAPLGLVHRDLSPGNVLVSREGEVKILDFGVAKITTNQRSTEDKAGVVKGTSGYMSPEQAAGKDVDLRTDLYQAGLLLHELLTGEPLFWRESEASTRELMQRHRVVRPSTLREEVPDGVDALVCTLLARDPEHRPSSAEWVATQIERLRAPAGRSAELAEFVCALDGETSTTRDLPSGPPGPGTQQMDAPVETFAAGPAYPEPPQDRPTASTRPPGTSRSCRYLGRFVWLAAFVVAGLGALALARGNPPDRGAVARDRRPPGETTPHHRGISRPGDFCSTTRRR